MTFTCCALLRRGHLRHNRACHSGYTRRRDHQDSLSLGAEFEKIFHLRRVRSACSILAMIYKNELL